MENIWRILRERLIILEKLPWFMFYEIGTDRYFEGWQTTSTRGQYKLKLVLPAWYPDQMPNLYVVSPLILWKYDRTLLNSEGVSQSLSLFMHRHERRSQSIC
jgi:hypothetical protein